MRFCPVAVGLRVLALVVDSRAGSRTEQAMLPETEVRTGEARRGAVASDVAVMVCAGGRLMEAGGGSEVCIAGVGEPARTDGRRRERVAGAVAGVWWW